MKIEIFKGKGKKKQFYTGLNQGMGVMKTGTKEWAKSNLNFQLGCEHGCRYCYAREMAVNRFNRCTVEQWTQPVIDNEKVDQPRGKRKGIIMFPSTHDLTPLNMSQYLCVLRKLLDAGNKVLIVSKPHWSCITVICDFYTEFRDQIMFRFTIGSMNDEILSFWEPEAPNFAERLACLQYAFQRGFKTSVSCEPYLDPLPHVVYTYCKGYLTDSFWIGKLKHFDRRVDLSGISTEEIEKFVKPLKAAQGDDIVKSMYRLLDGRPFVQWKDSIREVMKRTAKDKKRIKGYWRPLECPECGL